MLVFHRLQDLQLPSARPRSSPAVYHYFNSNDRGLVGGRRRVYKIFGRHFRQRGYYNLKIHGELLRFKSMAAPLLPHMVLPPEKQGMDKLQVLCEAYLHLTLSTVAIHAPTKVRSNAVPFLRVVSDAAAS